MKILRLGFILLFGLACLPLDAQAFRLLMYNGHPVHFDADRMPIPYWITDPIAPEVNAHAASLAVDLAFEHWREVEDVCLEFESKGPTRSPPSNYFDEINAVGWIEEGWVYAKEMIALTTSVPDSAVADGRIVSSDLEMNGVDFQWALIADGQCGIEGDSVDIENVVTHEAGHFVGLDHSDVADATMVAVSQRGDCARRTLETDDLEGIRALYGCDEPEAKSGSDDACSCRVIDVPRSGVPPAGVAFALVGTAVLYLRRRAHRA